VALVADILVFDQFSCQFSQVLQRYDAMLKREFDHTCHISSADPPRYIASVLFDSPLGQVHFLTVPPH